MATSKNKKIVDSQFIISKYMEYALEHDGFPKSVYKFCKEIKITEEEFYKCFGSLEKVNSSIWAVFFTTTVDAMHKNKEYAEFTSREKMLTFFYTFFEMLTLNRSYVLFALKESNMPLKNVSQLKELRRNIRDFAKDLIETDNEEKQYKITKNPVQVFSEGAWLQFLFLLNFWANDDSAQFEKTDIAIEKSVNTIFDLFDNTPLNSILDFGKFLWKEKVMSN